MVAQELDGDEASRQFELAIKELDFVRAENRHAGALTATLMALASAYLALMSRVILDGCEFQKVWLTQTAGCGQLDGWFYNVVSIPLVGIAGFIVLLFADILLRDTYALSLERYLHDMAGRPTTGDTGIPFPFLYLLSRRVWGDGRRPFILAAVWYSVVASGLMVFGGLAWTTLRVGRSTGEAPFWFYLAVGLWALVVAGFLRSAVRQGADPATIPSWLSEQLEDDV